MKFKKPFFIAEISANHEGSLNKAYSLVKSAKKHGADAVKLQTFTPYTMTLKSKKKFFKINSGLWKGRYLWDLYEEAKTPLEWHEKLFKLGKKIGIKVFSTPFDETAVDFLEKLNCPFYKVSSFEMTDLGLIKKISKTRKPIIISTGTSSLDEIELSFETARKYGSKDITLLYCVSNYPAKISDFNLNNIKILKDKFKCRIGLSDHSKDNSIAAAAAFAGAEVFEKHICLKNSNSLDSSFSLSSYEISKYKKVINNAYTLLGKKTFFRNAEEKKSSKFRKSIWIIKKIDEGERFTNKNIKKLRPGNGVSVAYYDDLLGKKSPLNLNKHSPVKNLILDKLKIKKKL